MTDALRTDLNDFLFTPIASDSNGMHLTMLSALARAGVDPWVEAAELAALPRESAIQKLVLMLAGVANGPSPGDDTATLAARLVAHLHPAPRPASKSMATPVAAARGEQGPLLAFSALPKVVRLSIYSLVGLIFMVMCFRALDSREAAAPTDSGQQQSR